MAEINKTLTGQADGSAGEKRGFRPFEAIAEGIRNSRARRSTIALFDTAMRFGERESIDEALASFTALPQGQKEKALQYLQDALKGCSSLPFENEYKTRRVAVIARLFEGAAVMLPVDGEGERATGPYADAMRMLKGVVEHDDLRERGKDEHAATILACVKALWELEYGNFDFWEARAHDSATRDYAITKLLEMPDTGESEEHGWFLLRKNLDSLGTRIAASGSPRAVPFLRCMLMDGDAGVIQSALKAAIYLEPILEEFFDIAGDISKIGGLESPAKDFISAGRFKQLLRGSEDNEMALRQLTFLYFNGMRHLAPLLDVAGRECVQSALQSNGDEERRLRKIVTLSNLAAAGIMPYDGETLRRLLSPLAGSPKAAGVFYDFAGIILSKSEDAGLRSAASAAETGRIEARLADLECADERQFAAAMELVQLLATGRQYLLQSGIIGQVMGEMVEVAYRPGGSSEAEQEAQRRGAVAVIKELAKFGIGVTMQPSSPDGVFTPEEIARAKEIQNIFAKYSTDDERGEEIGTPADSGQPAYAGKLTIAGDKPDLVPGEGEYIIKTR